jgi:hypothetical protein
LNPSPLGEVKVCHAGERRHPGSISVRIQKQPRVVQFRQSTFMIQTIAPQI